MKRMTELRFVTTLFLPNQMERFNLEKDYLAHKVTTVVRNKQSLWALDIVFDNPEDLRKFRRLVIGNKTTITEMAHQLEQCVDAIINGKCVMQQIFSHFQEQMTHKHLDIKFMARWFWKIGRG